MFIDAPRVILLVGTDWLRRYSANLFFNKKRLVFESKRQKLSISIEYDQTIESLNHKLEEYKVNTVEWNTTAKASEKYETQWINTNGIISAI